MEEYYEYLLKERRGRIRDLVLICGIGIFVAVVIFSSVFYFDLLLVIPKAGFSLLFFAVLLGVSCVIFLYNEFHFRKNTWLAYQMNIKKDV